MVLKFELPFGSLSLEGNLSLRGGWSAVCTIDWSKAPK